MQVWALGFRNRDFLNRVYQLAHILFLLLATRIKIVYD